MTEYILNYCLKIGVHFKDPRRDRLKKTSTQRSIFLSHFARPFVVQTIGPLLSNLAKRRNSGLRNNSKFEHGIPSHDTFGDVFSTINTGQFSECFSNWVADLSSLVEEDIIAIYLSRLRIPRLECMDFASGPGAKAQDESAISNLCNKVNCAARENALGYNALR